MARAKSSGLSRFARIQLIILALIFAVSFSAFMMIHPKHEMSDLQSYKESRSRRSSSKFASPPSRSGFCPSQCADGRAIDNRICPKMDPQLTNIILQSLRKDSKVVEWGSGASAIYFSQCVQEWNVVISDRQHCENIKKLKKKGFGQKLKIHCSDAADDDDEQCDVSRDLGCDGKCLDLVIADGSAKEDCVLSSHALLKDGGSLIATEHKAAASWSKLSAVMEVEKTIADAEGGDVAIFKSKASRTSHKSHAKKKFVISDEDDGRSEKSADVLDPSWNPRDSKHSSNEIVRHDTSTSKLDPSDMQTAMEKWKEDETILKWKRARRNAIISSPIPDKFGPVEAYPCGATCSSSAAKIENTICPMMFAEEMKLLLGSLGPKSVVWEWGSGTSTLYFSQCVGKWVSVEHEGAWCNQMRQLAPPNVEIRCVPIEEEYKESFGSPGKWDGSKREFKTYVEAIKEVKSWEQPPDVVLIDGRARGDCSVEALPYLNEKSLVFIHDWITTRFGGRDKYDKALKYYDIVDVVEVPPPQSWRSASGLVKLRPKPEALANAKRAAERGEWNKLEER
uniref:Methyltransferase domain-containing protein n=2 Tax=Guillardia theta TaxID=55529 RepID=A0A7S4KIB8_GUITH